MFTVNCLNLFSDIASGFGCRESIREKNGNDLN